MSPSCLVLSPPSLVLSPLLASWRALVWPAGPQKQAVGQGLIMGLYISPVVSPVDLNPTDKHSLGGWEEALGGVCEGGAGGCLS